MMSAPPWKQIITEQLEMLASEHEQLEYERNAPRADVTFELVCGWFDDSYHPHNNAFSSCFTVAELAALAEFNAVFERCFPNLPVSKGRIGNWHASDSWREVMSAAARALECIAI